jgi:hypothetical protein
MAKAKKTKRKYKKKALPARIGELATLERCSQLGGMIKEVVDRDFRGNPILYRQRAKIECHLDIYRYRGQLDTPEYDAGMIFRKAYIRYVLRIKVDDDVQGGRADAEMAMLALPHSKKLLDQAHSVLSQPQWMVIEAICGMDDTAGNSNRFETFRRGLEKLVELWKTNC